MWWQWGEKKPFILSAGVKGSGRNLSKLRLKKYELNKTSVISD